MKYSLIFFVHTLFLVIFAKKNVLPKIISKTSRGVSNQTNIKHMTAKIVNGIKIAINNYPYLAQITFGGSQFCGGVIITTRVILTAGHCTVRPGGFPSSFKYAALLGSTYTDRGYEYEVIKTLTNQKYLGAEFDYMYDLGMMLLHKRIKLGPNVKLAKLVNHKRWRNPKYSFVVAGYGTTHESGARSPVLKMTRMHYVDSEVCNRTWSDEPMPVTEHNFCMIGVGFTSDCNGDSGSAVIWKGTHVVGLVTTGRSGECASDTVPSMYTDLYYHGPWIQKSVKKLQAHGK